MNLNMPAVVLTLFSILTTVFLPGSVARLCPPEARLLEVGAFHGEEVDAETGERWLGLHISDEGSMLLEYEITVEAVEDLLVDDKGQKTGKQVSVNLPLKPKFLVSSDWVLTGGPVQTLFEGSYENYEKPIRQIDPVELKLADNSYALKIAGSDDAEKCWSEGLPKNATLVLTSGGTTQTLYTLEECGNDPEWFLLWAGDLDRDGKLDLYVSVTQHYNVSQKKLFLSSQADEGQLVAEVAEFVTSGC